MENTRTNKGIHVKKCLRANCKNTLSANQILQEVIDELVQRMDHLDQQYMSAAFKDLQDFQNFVEEQLQRVRQIVSAMGDINAKYLILKEDFLEQLYKEIEEFRVQVRQRFKVTNEEFKTQVSSVIERCKTEVIIPSLNELTVRANKDGIDKVYFDAIQQMRANFLKQFHSIGGDLRQSFENTKSDLAKVFVKIGLGALTGQQGLELLKAFCLLQYSSLILFAQVRKPCCASVRKELHQESQKRSELKSQWSGQL
jgi:archaellum component FlaC